MGSTPVGAAAATTAAATTEAYAPSDLKSHRLPAAAADAAAVYGVYGPDVPPYGILATSLATTERGLSCYICFENYEYTRQTSMATLVAHLLVFLSERRLAYGGRHTYSEMFINTKTRQMLIKFCQNYSIPRMQEVLQHGGVSAAEVDEIQVTWWLHVLRVIHVCDGTSQLCTTTEKKATS